MSTKNIFYFISALLLGVGLWSYYMWASYGNLPHKVDAIEKELELLKAQPDSSRAYLMDIQKLELKIEKTEQSIREDYDTLKKFGLPLTLIAFTGLFYSIYKSASGFAIDNAKKTVDRYYLPDEERFKIEKKLLVLTKEGGDSGFIRRLLKDTGFLSVSTIPENIKKLDEETFLKILDDNKYDLIFLNNELPADAEINAPNPFSNDDLELCLSKSTTKTMVFHFGKPNLSSALMTNHRVASAGFKSQVYGNLINALRYQQYLCKSTPQQQA